MTSRDHWWLKGQEAWYRELGAGIMRYSVRDGHARTLLEQEGQIFTRCASIARHHVSTSEIALASISFFDCI